MFFPLQVADIYSCLLLEQMKQSLSNLPTRTRIFNLSDVREVGPYITYHGATLSFSFSPNGVVVVVVVVACTAVLGPLLVPIALPYLMSLSVSKIS